MVVLFGEQGGYQNTSGILIRMKVVRTWRIVVEIQDRRNSSIRHGKGAIQQAKWKRIEDWTRRTNSDRRKPLEIEVPKSQVFWYHLDNVRKWNLEQRDERVRERTKVWCELFEENELSQSDMYKRIAFIVSCSS